MTNNLSLGPSLPLWPKFGPLHIFPWNFSLLCVRHCHKLSSYSISRKTYDPNSRKWQKSQFGPDIGPLTPNSGHHFFFIKLVVRNCCRLSFYAS